MVRAHFGRFLGSLLPRSSTASSRCTFFSQVALLLYIVSFRREHKSVTDFYKLNNISHSMHGPLLEIVWCARLPCQSDQRRGERYTALTSAVTHSQATKILRDKVDHHDPYTAQPHDRKRSFRFRRHMSQRIHRLIVPRAEELFGKDSRGRLNPYFGVDKQPIPLPGELYQSSARRDRRTDAFFTLPSPTCEKSARAFHRDGNVETQEHLNTVDRPCETTSQARAHGYFYARHSLVRSISLTIGVWPVTERLSHPHRRTAQPEYCM